MSNDGKDPPLWFYTMSRWDDFHPVLSQYQGGFQHLLHEKVGHPWMLFSKPRLFEMPRPLPRQQVFAVWIMLAGLRRRISRDCTATGRSHPHQTPQPNYY
uniref:Uncharacterized protein n=1 Tax=Attheya septentrionalis TaxID=420275 RepID=A0A7S2XTG0_9STRA